MFVFGHRAGQSLPFPGTAIRRVLRSTEDAPFSRARFRRSSMLDLLRRGEQNRFNLFADFSCTGRRRFADLGAAAARGKYLGGVKKPVGIEDLFDAHHGLEVRVSEYEIHEIFFLESDAMFAAQRTAHLDAKLHDLLAHAENLFHLLRITAVKENQRMQVAVACVKYVGNAKAVMLRHSVYRNENFGKPCAGDDSVHGDHVWSEAPHRTERALSAKPKPGAFFVVLC